MADNIKFQSFFPPAASSLCIEIYFSHVNYDPLRSKTGNSQLEFKITCVIFTLVSL